MGGVGGEKKLHVREGHVLGEAVTGLERHGYDLREKNVGERKGSKVVEEVKKRLRN